MLSGMVTEESSLLYGAETGTCASLADGRNEHGLRVLVGRGMGREKSANEMNFSRILQAEKSRNRPF